MSASKESLYDTQEAIALSLQLTGASQPASRSETSPYIRFSAGPRSRPEPSSVQRPSRPAPPPATGPSFELPAAPFESWEDTLKWIREVSEAKGVFVVDSQGFVLLREGDDQPDDGYEGAGANLGLAVDQLNQMEVEGGEIKMADLTYQNQSMLVIRVQDKDDDYFTLGVVDAENLSVENKEQIYKQVKRSLAQGSF